jgi:hypothetical protein
MDRSQPLWILDEGEAILWQGRPAPRCYTFRHWLQALIGTVLFFASSFWFMVGVQLVKSGEFSALLLLAPLILAVVAFFVGPGQLILARLRWEKIFYALTDRRLLVRNRLLGQKILTFNLVDYKQHKQKKYGKQLVSLRLAFRNRPAIILECLEHPELFLQHLESRTTAADSV